MKLSSTMIAAISLAVLLKAWPVMSSAQVDCFQPLTDIAVTWEVTNVGDGTNFITPDCPVIPGDIYDAILIFSNNGACTAPATELQVSVGNLFVFDGFIGPIEPGLSESLIYSFSAGPVGPVSFRTDFSNWGTTFVGLLVDVVAPIPDIEVSPNQLNFGLVNIGQVESQIISISNAGTDNLQVSGISQSGSSEFSTIPVTLLTSINRCEQEPIDITVSYAPTAAVSSVGTLAINSDDPDEPSISVNLNGSGSIAEIPTVQQIEEIKLFMDISLHAGTLSGDGPNAQSSGNRFDALVNMISAAGDMLAFGDVLGACDQLTDAYNKTDGFSKPPDFVKGSAANDLADLISQVMFSLSCQP